MACYNEEIFSAIEEFQESLTCPIGLGILKDPVTDSCGHTFCRNCITLSLNEIGSCPFSKVDMSINDFEDNTNIKEWIDTFECKCINFEATCKWTGIIAEIENHVEICEFHEVNCTIKGCQTKVQRFRLENHEKSCGHRIVECELCNLKMSSFQLPSHKLYSCPETDIKCLAKCSLTYKRKFARFHEVYACEKERRDLKLQFKDFPELTYDDVC